MKSIIRRIKKLTLFDKIIIVGFILAAVFFSYIFFRKSTYLTVTIKVSQENIVYPYLGVPDWFSQLFYDGMREKDGLGRTRAEVIKILSYDSSSSRKAIYLTTKLNVIYNRGSNQYTYKGYPVLVGSALKLYLDKLLVDGMVTHIEGIEDKRKKVKLVLKAQVREETVVFPETSGVRDYIANALGLGDEVKDSSGDTIIKITNKVVEDAKKITTASDGRVLLQTDPLRKDVFLTLEVTATYINGRYYIFDDVPILIGYGIPIHTSEVAIWPEVTEIKEL